MTIVRELVTLLGFETDDESFRAAQEDLEIVAEVAAGVVASVAAVGGAMLALAKTTADYGDEVANTAEMLAISTDALQELRYAASLANVGTEELTTGLRKLLVNQGAARGGSKELVKAFGELGISQAELANGEPLDALFERVADRLSKVVDPSKRAELAVKLLGRAGQQLVPFMSQGTTSVKELREAAHTLGLVMSGDVVAAADEFNDSWDTLHQVVSAVGRSIGGELLPDGIKLIKFIQALVLANKDMVRLEIGSIFQGFVTGARAAWQVVEHLVLPVVRLVGQFGGLKTVAGAAGVALGYLALTSLGNLITSFAAVTVAGGGVLGMLRTLSLAPALVAVKWILLAAAVALVADEIYTTATGGKSVINDLRALLSEPISDDDNWMVKSMKRAVEIAREATAEIRALAALLSEAGVGKGVGPRWEKFKKDWEEGADPGIRLVKGVLNNFDPRVDRVRQVQEEELGMSLRRTGAAPGLSADSVFQSRTQADIGREHFPTIAAAADWARQVTPSTLLDHAPGQGLVERAANAAAARISTGTILVNVDARGRNDAAGVGTAVGVAVQDGVSSAVQEAYQSIESSEQR